jgi:hypothetical protein
LIGDHNCHVEPVCDAVEGLHGRVKQTRLRGTAGRHQRITKVESQTEKENKKLKTLFWETNVKKLF